MPQGLVRGIEKGGIAIFLALLGVVAAVVQPFFPHPSAFAELPTYPTGTLLRCGQTASVYYLGSDNKRYLFPNDVVYKTWFSNYTAVISIPETACGQLSLGGNVTVRPGAVLLQFKYSTTVYAVSGQTLRPIASETIARALYGTNWNLTGSQGPLRSNFAEILFNDYTIGEAITNTTQYNATTERNNNPSVNVALGLGPIVVPTPPAPPAPPAGPVCGNTQCETGETTTSCAVDCPATVPAGPVCGNGTCETGETTTSCAADCPASAGGAGPTLGVSDPNRVMSQSSLALQPVGQRFTDPAFGTTLRRVTDKVAGGGFGTQVYSQLQAFSADSSHILVIENENYVVRRVDTLAQVPINLNDVNAPRWQPARTNTIVAYDTNGDTTLRVQYFAVGGAAPETVYTFPAAYQRIRGNQSNDELSHDGKWIVGMAAMSNGDQNIFALNLENRSLGAQISLNGLYNSVCARDPQYGVVEPDWIGVSPRGNYLVVQWKRDGSTRCSGMETYSPQTGAFVGHPYDNHQHGDLGADSQGEFFMTFKTTDTPNGDPYISTFALPGPAIGVSPTRLLTRLQWSQSGWHISCQGPEGFCSVVTAGPQPLGGEIMLQYTDGRILRLAHHRSTSCGYWVQPRGTVSRDARYVAFASDWGTNRCPGSVDGLGRGEAYILELPTGVTVGPAAVPPTTPPPTTEPSPAPVPGTTPPTSSAIGTVGPLPASTYALATGETITMAPAEGGGFYLEPRLGVGTCFATDFIKYDIYRAPIGSSSYTLVGSHTGVNGGEFLPGVSVETGGCAKDRLIYSGVGTGAYTAAVCITNAQNTAQRICKTLTIGG